MLYFVCLMHMWQDMVVIACALQILSLALWGPPIANIRLDLVLPSEQAACSELSLFLVVQIELCVPGSIVISVSFHRSDMVLYFCSPPAWRSCVFKDGVLQTLVVMSGYRRFHPHNCWSLVTLSLLEHPLWWFCAKIPVDQHFLKYLDQHH